MLLEILLICFVFSAHCFTHALDVVEYRGFQARKQVQPMIQERRDASVKVQAMYRGHIERKKFAKMQQEREQGAANIQSGNVL